MTQHRIVARRVVVSLFCLTYHKMLRLLPNRGLVGSQGLKRTMKKIDVLQSRPSAGGHKILNFTSKMLDFSTTGYLPFYFFFECIYLKLISNFWCFDSNFSIFWKNLLIVKYRLARFLESIFVNSLKSRLSENIAIFSISNRFLGGISIFGVLIQILQFFR